MINMLSLILIVQFLHALSAIRMDGRKDIHTLILSFDFCYKEFSNKSNAKQHFLFNHFENQESI